MNTAPRTLRPLAWGFLAGLALSLARAPLGLDTASIPAASAADAYLFRGLALGVVALALGRWSGARPRMLPILGGIAAGYALHGLVLAPGVEITSRLGLLAALVALAVVLRLLGLPGETDADPAQEPASDPGVFERTALLVAGAGVAISLEAVARPLRLLGGSLPADDSAFGAVFLVLVAFAAAAFGPLLPRRLGGAVFALLLALTALAGMESLRAVETFSTRDGLELFLKGWPWRLDITHPGRFWGDVLIGARVLLAPAFLLGTALCAAKLRSRLSWTVFGAALAMLARPSVLSSVDPGESGGAGSVSALRVVLGTLLAGLGGALAAISARDSTWRERILAGAICPLIAGFGIFEPRPQVLPLSPWERFQVQSRLAIDAPLGLLTVEPTRDLGLVATLDRRRLSPSALEEAGDEQRIRLAWEYAAGSSPLGGEGRVLLIGQLTPARARVLRSLGAIHIDRSGAWHAHMESLEAQLFEGQARPPGRILAPEEVREQGPWALVLVPPVAGAAPAVRPAEPGIGPRVVWLSTKSWSAHRGWGDHVRLSSSGLEDICLAVQQPDGLPAGDPVAPPPPWRLLQTRPFEREVESTAAAMQRLAEAARGTAWLPLAEGLALHAAAQVRSSPFETRAQQIELDRDALILLREAALERAPDRFVRELWNDLAAVLSDKREIELVQEHVAPLAARWRPWWQLELCVARADLEALDPGGACERLLRVVAEQPLDLRLRILCADALSMAGRPAQAAEQLHEVDRIQPGRRDVRRRLAMALARAGEPQAAALIEELLAEDPGDEELRAFLGPGPFPPVEVRYVPFEDQPGADRH